MAEKLFAVASYTDARWGDPGVGVGLVVVGTDPGGSGRLRAVPGTVAVPNPSFLVVLDGDLVATSEQPVGGLARMRIEGRALELLEVEPSGGAAPCHLSVVDGVVVVAHYSSGDLSGFGAGEGGLTPLWQVSEEGTGPRTDRQEASHVHSATAWREFIVSANLGTDRLTFYRARSTGAPARNHEVRMPAGSGPRHLAAGADILYITGELDSRVHWVLAHSDGTFGYGGSVASTTAVSGVNHPSHLALLSERGMLVVANRGADTLAVFDVSGSGGEPVPLADIALAGRQPRHFAASGEFIVVAEEASSTIELLDIRAADPSEWRMVDSMRTGSPNCILEISAP